MALKICKECGKDISTKAKKCPNCGAPAKKSHGFLKFLGIIILLFILWGLIRNLAEEDSKENRTNRFSPPPKEMTKKEGQKPAVRREKVIMPNYSVLNENVYDIPLKTQVELNILVSGEISETGLTALLNKLYSSTKAKRGFKYHNPPTNIYIYAFTSKERAESGMGQWIAMLQESPGDLGPRISVNKRQIAQLGAKPEEKFGLSEATRKQIWSEIVKAEDRATKEAEERHPLLSPSKPGYSQSLARKRIEEQIDLERKINDRYRNELAKKYGLTLEQLKEIALEGVTKDWPFPK